MNTSRFVRLVLSATCMLLTLGPVAASFAAGNDPMTVVNAWIAAGATGSADAQLALFTDDGVITLQPPPPGSSGVFRGKAQISAFLHGLGAGKVHSTATHQVMGDTVTATGMVTLPSLAQIGIPSVAFTAVFVVRNGKLLSFAPTLHFTAAQAALLRAAGPPQSMPNTGGLSVVAQDGWLLLLASLGCVVMGLTLRRRAAAACLGTACLP